MASTFSTDLALELVATGEKAGLWGSITNTNLQVLQQSTQEQVLQGEAGQLRKSARKAPFMAVGRNIQNQFQTLRERAATRKIGGN